MVEGATRQRSGPLWAHILLLVLFLALLTYAFFLAHGSARDGDEIDIGFTAFRMVGDTEPWVLVALAAAAGSTLNSISGSVYHAFVAKDFDEGGIPFHWFRIVHATFITIVFFALGSLALPGELLEETLRPNPPLLAFAFLLGYFSEDTFERVRVLFKRLLGADPTPRVGLGGSRLEGADFLVDSLLRTPGVPAQLGIGADKARDVVARLESRGIRYTHQLLASTRHPRQVQRTAYLAGCSEEALQRLVALADLARVAGSLEDAVAMQEEDPGATAHSLLQDARAAKPGRARRLPAGRGRTAAIHAASVARQLAR
jgi:hypothetical protein